MRIYVYDAANPANPWKVYDSTAPPFVQTLSELVRGFGYWIYYEQPVVVVAGDVNVDGRADFIVGAWQAAPGGRADAGSAYVYSGADGSLLYQKDGGATGDTFGWSVSAAGDVNWDGMADFIVGATRADPGGRADAGSVYVYSGADGSLLYQRDGGAEYNNFGHSVSAAGDVNGDGKADFIVGERLADPGGRLGAGSAYVYSGADGSILYQKDGVAANDRLGVSVSTAGDVNGDGKADFIVGAFWPTQVAGLMPGALTSTPAPTGASSTRRTARQWAISSVSPLAGQTKKVSEKMPRPWTHLLVLP